MKNLITQHLTSASDRLNDYLSKAVAAHPSQIQQRQRTGRFVTSHHSRTQSRNEKGRFVGLLPNEEREAAAARMPVICQQLRARLSDHQQDVASGHLSPVTAGKRGRRDILEYYDSLFRIGKQAAGNPGIILSPADKATINRAANDEADYFDNFMQDVHAGTGRMPYPERLDCYANAGQHAYWLGWTMANTSPRRRIIWHLGPTDHCKTCNTLAKEGPMSIKQFTKSALSKGYVPQSGDLDCKGIRCQCWLTDEYLPRSQ